MSFINQISQDSGASAGNDLLQGKDLSNRVIFLPETILKKADFDRRSAVLGRDRYGQNTIQLISPRGSTLNISEHGGVVTSFVSTLGQEVTYLNPYSQNPHGLGFNAALPFRGGLFACIPSFGAEAEGGVHGFGRISKWKLAGEPLINGMRESSISVKFELTADSVPESLPNMNKWKNPDFKFTQTHTLTDNQFKTELVAINYGSEPLTIRPCFHDYFRFSDVYEVMVRGLQNKNFLQMIGDGSISKPAARLSPPIMGIAREEEQMLINTNHITGGEIEKIFLGVNKPISICNYADQTEINLSSSDNMTARVIWNPGQGKGQPSAMPDFKEDEYHKMACVECLCEKPLEIPGNGGSIAFFRIIKISQLV